MWCTLLFISEAVKVRNHQQEAWGGEGRGGEGRSGMEMEITATGKWVEMEGRGHNGQGNSGIREHE